MKHVWIVNYYVSPPEFITHERHLKFAHYLQEKGYKVTLFSTSYWQRENIDFINNGRNFQYVDYGEFHFCHIKSAHYNSNGLKRAFSIFQFAYRLFLYRKHFEKPDVILHNIHEPFDYPVSWCAKRLGAKYIVDDWDLWAFAMSNYGFVKKDGIIDRFIRYTEYSLFKKADAIVFSMEGGKEYIKDRGYSTECGGKIDPCKVFYINNGVDLAQFEHDAATYRLEDEDLEDEAHFKAVYLGSISQANDVEKLVEAAKYLKDESRLKILIYGDGSDRERLEQLKSSYNLENLIFKQKRIPMSKVPFVLRHCNLSIMNHNLRGGKYGLSLGKLFQYLAAGNPICTNITPQYNYIEKYNLGVSKVFSSPKEYADAILSFLNMPQSEYQSMSNRVKKAAMEFDYPVLSQKLIDIIDKLFD